ncbi:MAG: aminotransferase class V-fold PLP-dependent enzyme, partial [Bacilli bacterium]|nr:aminotransferase class V-fold PLP-dependent enzyme [Bacilli bacterium]
MNEYRQDFPMMNKKYVYFNSASTAYKPQAVIDEIKKYYENYSVNTNRGVDSLGYQVTQKYENVRKQVANFIGARNQEIVFTRGTTDGLNLVAQGLAEKIVEGDEIIVSYHEHHANFLPWQELCHKKNAKLIIVDVINGQVDIEGLKNKINTKTKIVAFYHTSNVFGGTNDLSAIAQLVHKYNAYFVVDGAQGIVHEKIDVKKTDIDFYAFSGHKLFGPTGVGVLYGKYELLDDMYPITFGGEMIDIVGLEKTTYKKAPYKFEAGTMMIAEVLGLGAALTYVNNIGYEKMKTQVNMLHDYLITRLKQEIQGIEIYNINVEGSSLITFNIKDIHAHD